MLNMLTKKGEARADIALLSDDINFYCRSIMEGIRRIAEKDPDLACRLGKRARQVIIPTMVKVINGIEESSKGAHL